MPFTGLYFDGVTAKGRAANITVISAGLDISYNDNEGAVITKTWQPDRIHKNDVDQGQKVILKYGEYPFQYLEVDDPGFAGELKAAFPHAKFYKSAYNLVFGAGFKGVALLALAFIGLLALAYWVILPAAAERLAATLPLKWEQQIGEATYDKMVEDEQVDSANSTRITQFFRDLNYKSKYPVQVIVVRDNIVNAFALPGGKIVVYEGILRTVDNYPELAALLSHEFSHIELKHSTKNLFRSMSSYLFVSLLFGDANGATTVIVQNANQLKQLGYSRTLEEEADRNGLRLMKQRQIDPEGMTELFQKLKKEEHSGQIPKFLSNHPLTGDRIEYINADIALKDYQVVDDHTLDSLWKEIKKDLEN